jgi:hypothetical protein
MTVRFRPVEANELVDDERAAQRIYMGSAMTMEPGEQRPIASPMQTQLPAALVYYASDVCRKPPSPILQPQLFILHISQCDGSVALSSTGCSLRAAPLRCLKRPFMFLIPQTLYYSTNKTPAWWCSVTLGIRLSFHVHDHWCTRATCTSHKPAAPFSLCISLPAAVRGRLLTCRSRNAAPAAASAAQRLRTVL